jgi:hypothetical protein
MRSFVLKSRLNRLLTVKSVATMSLLALVGTGCSNADVAEHDEEINHAMARLEGAGGAPGTGAVTASAVSSSSGGGDGGAPDPDKPPTSSSSSSGGGSGPGGPTAFWKFDDCQVNSSLLQDFSGNGGIAIRSATASCAQGIDGLAVSFDDKKDSVQAPNQPLFTLDENLTVAAWVKPTTVDGTRSIVQRRAPGELSFFLNIIDGDVVFKVTLSSGKVVTSRAPISAGEWTHVAGLYDGHFLFLFLDGQQVGQVSAAGTLRNVAEPIRIGGSGAQRFDGLIDEVWFSKNPVDPSQIAELSCINQPPTLSVTPPTSGVVQPDTTVTYSVSVTNNDVGACAPANYFMQLPFSPPGFNIDVDPFFFPDVTSGETVTFPLSVTGTSAADPGVHDIPFTIFDFNDFDTPVSGQVTYELEEPSGCFVKTNRELIVKGLSVVDDPIRTTFNGPASDPRTGAWTFGKLMQNMAPTPADAPAFATQLFNTWLTDQTVNGFTVPARSEMQSQVLAGWPRNLDNTLDLTKSPLRLLAIVNRIDLRNLAAGNAGEGRFVFGVEGGKGDPLQFTVILEYLLPASTPADVLDWANAWHALGTLPFPSEAYNSALQAITTRFADRNAAPGRPNGSALSQLRTNEIALASPWELREFTISPSTGLLQQSTVKLTPDLDFDQSPTLASFVNANEADILLEKHTVPELFAGSPFLGGASLNNLTAWTAPGINNNEARHRFSLNTCNGCHGFAETGTAFLHVSPRFPGSEAQLSGFMAGTTVLDPVTGAPRTFNDLGRRKVDLEGLVCATMPPASGSAKAAGTTVSIAKGINRVH